MANIKSQIKRNKQNEKRHERNKSVKTGLKSAIRKFREAAEAGDKETAVVLGRDASKKLEDAASTAESDADAAKEKAKSAGEDLTSGLDEASTKLGC